MKGKTALSFNALNLPGSMNFLAFCDNTFLRLNFMQGYTEAINLEGATLPHRFEMNAGSPAPLDNYWNDPPLNPGDYTDRVTGSTAGGGYILWYYQPGTDRLYNLNDAFLITSFMFGIPVAMFPACLGSTFTATWRLTAWCYLSHRLYAFTLA
jgi:hypothetical protein